MGNRLDFEAAQLRGLYDRRPFLLSHGLAAEPLLTREKLFALALRRPPEDVLFRVGRVPVSVQLEEAHVRYPTGLSLPQTLAQFDGLRAAVTINFPEQDAEYRPLAEALITELREALRPLGEEITWTATYLFLSSPGAVTPYHMDREVNFLLQIAGRKRVRLWDPWDQRVMTTEDVERLFALWGRIPKPGFRPELDAMASEHLLEPGAGIHHPFIAPHAVETLDQPAISWALTFRTRATDRVSELAKVNHHLRRFGLRCGRPGTAGLADSAKLVLGSAAKVALHAGRKVLAPVAGQR